MSNTYRINNLDTVLDIIDPDLENRALNEVRQVPYAYMEVVDTDGTVIDITTCTEFRVTHAIGDMYGSFNASIVRSSSWNELGSLEVLKTRPDIRRRVKLYVGQKIGSVYKSELIFIGIPIFRPESYQHGSSDRFSMRGYGLGYLMSKLDGEYSEDYFSGTSQELINYWMGEAGLEAVLDYTDDILYDTELIAFTNINSGISNIKTSLGPSVEYWNNYDGLLYMKETPTDDAEESDFTLESKNLLSLSLNEDGTKVITQARAVGYEEIEYTEYASSSDISKYGLNSQTVTSNVMTTTAALQAMTADILKYSKKFQHTFKAKVTLNPYMKVGRVVTINEDSLAKMSSSKVYIESVRHTYKQGDSNTTDISGFVLYE